jgi:hypothetical protein
LKVAFKVVGQFVTDLPRHDWIESCSVNGEHVTRHVIGMGTLRRIAALVAEHYGQKAARTQRALNVAARKATLAEERR